MRQIYFTLTSSVPLLLRTASFQVFCVLISIYNTTIQSCPPRVFFKFHPKLHLERKNLTFESIDIRPSSNFFVCVELVKGELGEFFDSLFVFDPLVVLGHQMKLDWCW